MNYDDLLKDRYGVGSKKVGEMIQYLYETIGMPRSEIYKGLKETMNDAPSHEYIDEVLSGLKRSGKRDPNRKTYDEIRRDRTEKENRGNVSDVLRAKNAAIWRRNYIEGVAFTQRVKPRLFHDDIRTSLVNIYNTDES